MVSRFESTRASLEGKKRTHFLGDLFNDGIDIIKRGAYDTFTRINCSFVLTVTLNRTRLTPEDPLLSFRDASSLVKVAQAIQSEMLVVVFVGEDVVPDSNLQIMKTITL